MWFNGLESQMPWWSMLSRLFLYEGIGTALGYAAWLCHVKEKAVKYFNHHSKQVNKVALK